MMSATESKNKRIRKMIIISIVYTTYNAGWELKGKYEV